MPFPIEKSSTAHAYTVPGAIVVVDCSAYQVTQHHTDSVTLTPIFQDHAVSRTRTPMAYEVPDEVLKAALEGGACLLDDKITQAIQRYGGEDGVFNTANLQNAIGEDLSTYEIERMLAAHHGVVRLSGGCHWMRLPHALRKHDSYQNR